MQRIKSLRVLTPGCHAPGARCQEKRCHSLSSSDSMQVARGSVPCAVFTAGCTQNMSGCASGNPGGSLMSRSTSLGRKPAGRG